MDYADIYNNLPDKFIGPPLPPDLIGPPLPPNFKFFIGPPRPPAPERKMPTEQDMATAMMLMGQLPTPWQGRKQNTSGTQSVFRKASQNDDMSVSGSDSNDNIPFSYIQQLWDSVRPSPWKDAPHQQQAPEVGSSIIEKYGKPALILGLLAAGLTSGNKEQRKAAIPAALMNAIRLSSSNRKKKQSRLDEANKVEYANTMNDYMARMGKRAEDIKMAKYFTDKYFSQSQLESKQDFSASETDKKLAAKLSTGLASFKEKAKAKYGENIKIPSDSSVMAEYKLMHPREEDSYMKIMLDPNATESQRMAAMVGMMQGGGKNDYPAPEPGELDKIREKIMFRDNPSIRPPNWVESQEMESYINQAKKYAEKNNISFSTAVTNLFGKYPDRVKAIQGYVAKMSEEQKKRDEILYNLYGQ